MFTMICFISIKKWRIHLPVFRVIVLNIKKGGKDFSYIKTIYRKLSIYSLLTDYQPDTHSGRREWQICLRIR